MSICFSGTSSCPFIQRWNNTSEYTLTITGGTPCTGEPLSPPIGTSIGPKNAAVYAFFSQLDVTITSSDGTIVGIANVSISTQSGNTIILDANGFITANYNGNNSSYSGSTCEYYWNYLDISVNVAPSFLTNAGWNNGLKNSSSTLIAGQNYWGVDYGADRWEVSTLNDNAIYQTTDPNMYGGAGSRAFAFNLLTGDPDYKTDAISGVALDGLWQIDIKIGSNGNDGFVETFYLAERFNLTPGVSNYYDGNGGGQKQFSREIDIMETHWQPSGPQVNCEYIEGADQYWNNNLYQSVQMGKWSDVGGAPTSDFITFGALIRGASLWIYAYKPDGTQWYVTAEIPNNNSSYVQKGPFVPYIGTWKSLNATTYSEFNTGYKNFVYLAADDTKIALFNPLNNPENFGPILYAPSL